MTTGQLHIAYLNQDFFPEVGAGPARVLEMSRRWQQLGARVTVIAGMPSRRIPGRGEGTVDPRYAGKLFVEEEWDGVRVLRSWAFTGDGRGLRNKLVNMASYTATGFLSALTAREHFDIFVASSPPFPPHVFGVALAALARSPLVMEIRDLWPDYMVEMGIVKNRTAQRAVFGLERWLLARADHTVVVTESFRNRVVEKGVPRECTTVIPNGVDLSNYYAEPAATNRDQPFTVGYLGTFGRGQALARIVEAAAIVEKADPTIRILLVGDGPDMPAVQAAIVAHRVHNITLRPPIDRHETRAFYNSCDACLVPLAPLKIFNETVPSKMFEIMACERPVIASLAGEAADVVEKSGCGLCVEPGNSAAIADAIIRMSATAPEERAAMGCRGRAYVAAHYDRIVLADRYFVLLSQLAAERSFRCSARTIVKA